MELEDSWRSQNWMSRWHQVQGVGYWIDQVWQITGAIHAEFVTVFLIINHPSFWSAGEEWGSLCCLCLSTEPSHLRVARCVSVCVPCGNSAWPHIASKSRIKNRKVQQHHLHQATNNLVYQLICSKTCVLFCFPLGKNCEFSAEKFAETM